MNVKGKKKEPKRGEIEIFAPLILRFIIACSLPWVYVSGLDRHLDSNSEGKFEWWDFYWSFPATHLSWLSLTLLFGLPLWGLLSAPLVIPACVFADMIDLSLSAVITGIVLVIGIWIGLYCTTKHYRSKREVREIRGEIYREGELNEA